MKLLTKLSTLIKAMARGPAQQPSKRAPVPDDVPDTELAAGASAVEQDQPLEGGRVADLLQRKLASSETNPRQREKGD